MFPTAFIVAGTIVSGCLASLLTKYQDNQCVAHCNDPLRRRTFEQPTIQTLQMFIGELSLYLVYYSMYQAPWSARKDYAAPLVNKTGGVTPRDVSLAQTFYLAIPSVCDLLATTLMNMGLLYTPVSTYQMTRGSLVLFVAVFSVVFLRRRIRRLEWLALVFVSLGVAIVGYSGSSGRSMATKDPTAVVFGTLLVFGAVALQAVQFVVEEHILAASSLTPMRLVYTEGFFGTTILVSALVVLHFAFLAAQSDAAFAHSPFNLVQSYHDTFALRAVVVSSLLVMVCIATFNLCGLSLTSLLSAAARSTIDNCRTLLVWVVAMVLGWESFSVIQLSGFAVMVFGTLCFNGILRPEDWSWVPQFLKDPEHKYDLLIDVVDEPI